MSNRSARAIKITLLAVCCALFVLASSRARSFAAEDQCLGCHVKLDAANQQIITLHNASSHGKAAVGCADCHRGDAAQTEKAKAHSGMVAKSVANALLDACGRCHISQLAQFKTSRHFQTRQGEPRLDCAECHGVHSIGRPSESFSFTQFCAGCHGLEYLPALPQRFQDLLVLSDELRDTFNQPQRSISSDAQKQRREIRHLTAEIVHLTDRASGLARIPSILAQGERLRAQIKPPSTKK